MYTRDINQTEGRNMDFEVIDRVHADTLGSGDIVRSDGEFHQLLRSPADDGDILEVTTYNLTTGEDGDTVIFEPDEVVDIYQTS